MRTLPALLILLLLAGPALAAKTDVLVMRNGDRITCEIKKLEHGKLTAKTDDMGTLQVEWDKIARVTSAIGFLVRTSQGLLHYGTLVESSADGLLAVSWAERLTELPLDAVTGLEQVKSQFWDKVTVAVSLGFTNTQATSVTQLNFAGNADYRGRVHGFGLGFSSNITDKGTDDPLYRRWNANLYHARQLSGRLWSDLSLGGERNDELGLKLRALGGAGAGYRIVESGSSALQANLGLNLAREWAGGDAAPETTLEGRIGASFAVFAYDTPKTNVDLGLNVYPSFTIADRVRRQLDIAARREVAKDLFVELTFYLSSDSRPPAGASAKEDRGVVFSVGWSK